MDVVHRDVLVEKNALVDLTNNPLDLDADAGVAPARSDPDPDPDTNPESGWFIVVDEFSNSLYCSINCIFFEERGLFVGVKAYLYGFNHINKPCVPDYIRVIYRLILVRLVLMFQNIVSDGFLGFLVMRNISSIRGTPRVTLFDDTLNCGRLEWVLGSPID
jgi:hypothetical protein